MLMKENEEVMERKYECSTMKPQRRNWTLLSLISENSPSFFCLAYVKKMNKQSYKVNSIDKNVKKEITS